MSGYRGDIDGLRAVAVTLVVLFHAGVPGVPGGFIGVDAFFVISGYLISDILWRELSTERFSLLRFYDRRARRILPALLVVLLATTALGWLFLVPGELRELGANVLWSALAAGNMLALRNSGYFDGNTQDNLLLHTWSLGVEEQFYVIWPLLLAACWRFLGRRTWPLLVVSVLSLAAAEWAVRKHPSAAFYLLPTRAWELALGGLLAVSGWRANVSRPVRLGLSAVALAALLVCGVLYSEATPFPGLSALAPCAAAAALIALGSSDNLVSRLLGSRPCVWLGKRSYSLYLWHWPLLAVARVHLNRPLELRESLPLMGLALVLSEASFRWVESPFRDTRSSLVARLSTPIAAGWRVPRSLVVGLLATAFVAGTGQLLVSWRGLPGRQPAEVARYEAARADTTRSDVCHRMQNDASIPPAADCTFGAAPGANGQVLLWGDSHADHFRPGLEHVARAKQLSVRQATKTTCPPLSQTVTVVNRGRRTDDCSRFNQAVLELASTDPAIKVVAMAARWAAYAEGRAGGPIEEADLFVTATSSAAAPLSRETSRAALDRGLRVAVERLVAAGKTVVLFGQTPEFAGDVPKCLARETAAGRDASHCAQARAQIDARGRFVDNLLGSIAATSPARIGVLLPSAALCDARECWAFHQGVVTMRDSNHLTRAASLLLAPELGRAWPASG